MEYCCGENGPGETEIEAEMFVLLIMKVVCLIRSLSDGYCEESRLRVYAMVKMLLFSCGKSFIMCWFILTRTARLLSFLKDDVKFEDWSYGFWYNFVFKGEATADSTSRIDISDLSIIDG